MKELEVKDVVELAVEAEQGLELKKGVVFVAGIITGVVAHVVIPKVLRGVRSVFTTVASKRAAKQASKEQVEN